MVTHATGALTFGADHIDDVVISSGICRGCGLVASAK
jgi:hypothetical protein